MIVPYIEDFFLALGFQAIDSEKLEYKREDLVVLRGVLANIRKIKDTYEQVPEDQLAKVSLATQEEMKKRQEIEKLDKQAQLDKKDKKKDYIPPSFAKDIRFKGKYVAASQMMAMPAMGGG